MTRPISKMKSQATFTSDSEEQTLGIAAALGRVLKTGDIVTLEGELGAGKTVFVRGLAVGLGLRSSTVSSPTFVICQEHESSLPEALSLVHIDAYRIKGQEDLATIGWPELLHQERTVFAIEWPSRIQQQLPSERIEVNIEHVSEKARQIIIHARTQILDRLREKPSSPSSQSAVKCRICGGLVGKNAKTFPFCSERCRLADLGRWFNEGYRTSRELQADDELED